MSWLAVVALGAKQLKLSSVSAWADPVFDAFVAGAHLVYWTDRAIYWIAKPTTHVETTPFGRRLHRDDGPALSSDLENLYFWHGILVPEHIIMRPEIITEREIGNEVNQEVRRVMIERYGYGRYMASSPIVHQDATGRLRRRDGIQVVEVVNGTAEPDGSFRHYVLSVPPNLNTAQSAVAWTYGMSVSEYSKLIVRT